LYYQFVLFTTALLLLWPSAPISARNLADYPPGNTGSALSSAAYCTAGHNVGKINMMVSNGATFGYPTRSGPVDCFTGDELESCEYPKGSRTKYLFLGAFWIGAVSGRDTLVSTGADGWQQTGNEFHPEESPLGDMIYRSLVDPSSPDYDGAVSEQDYIAVYYDTCTNCPGLLRDVVDNRNHKPLNIEVIQRSYAWSYAYAEDFVLFDYAIRNIGRQRLSQIYMGFYVDADIHSMASGSGASGAQDDITGFHEKLPALYLPDYCAPDSDVVNIAWTADNDGDLLDEISVPHLTGTRIVRSPLDSMRVSFNWWISNSASHLDFGPQSRENLRDFGHGGTGTPEGDRNKYFLLRNGEFDYDQVRVASIDPLDPTWLPPPENYKYQWAVGMDTRYLLSFGPFEIEPGQTLPLSFAYVAGENFHISETNIDNLPNDPDAYYEGVDFSDLGTNATWADWIYDNPGVDTDTDGFFGEKTICNLGSDSTLFVDTSYDTLPGTDPLQVDTSIDSFYTYAQADTFWRKGDGVPDFRGASPPPAPSTYRSAKGVSGLRVHPSLYSIRLLWNGVMAENARDIFSREYDFEGFRVYLARDDRRLSYTTVATYDREDYNKYVWDQETSRFVLLESPFTLEELTTAYSDGDPTWHPLDNPRNRPYQMVEFPDSIFYFENQDYNRYILGNDPVHATTPIKKVYPNAPRPWTTNFDSIPDSLYSDYLTEDGFFKFYEYEMTLENLLPTVRYWINVTAFDYGSPRSGLESLETSPTLMPAVSYALESTGATLEDGPEVFVYPNPYRTDADYRQRGYEGRGESDRPVDRTRAINFANLPSQCTIRIYSLDGDLVRELIHEVDPTDPLASHDSWDLITRNTQLVVSGLYYWVVEDTQGHTQIGKLVIIL